MADCVHMRATLRAYVCIWCCNKIISGKKQIMIVKIDDKQPRYGLNRVSERCLYKCVCTRWFLAACLSLGANYDPGSPGERHWVRLGRQKQQPARLGTARMTMIYRQQNEGCCCFAAFRLAIESEHNSWWLWPGQQQPHQNHGERYFLWNYEIIYTVACVFVFFHFFPYSASFVNATRGSVSFCQRSSQHSPFMSGGAQWKNNFLQ